MTTTSEASSTILAAMSGASPAETAPCEEEKWAAKFEEEFEEWERETFGVNFPKGDGEAKIHSWGDTSWKHMLVFRSASGGRTPPFTCTSQAASWRR